MERHSGEQHRDRQDTLKVSVQSGAGVVVAVGRQEMATSTGGVAAHALVHRF